MSTQLKSVKKNPESDFKLTQIVPGDKIQSKAKDTFDEDALIKALDKRYRNEPTVEGDVLDKALTMDKLTDAVEFLKDHLVQREGHDRDVILNPQELQDRALRGEANGMMTALIKCLSLESATEAQIKAVVGQQIAMRKLKRDAYNVANALVTKMVDEKYVYLKSKSSGTTWCLMKNKRLKPENYLDFYKKALRIDQEPPIPVNNHLSYDEREDN